MRLEEGDWCWSGRQQAGRQALVPPRPHPLAPSLHRPAGSRAAKERPLSGVVVRAGPGKVEEGGKRKAPRVKEGDKVVYFK